jgi:hypothetical protein
VAKRVGYPCLMLDGTLIPIGRVAADRPYYSGKHRIHGMNIQILTTPDGTPLFTRHAPAGCFTAPISAAVKQLLSGPHGHGQELVDWATMWAFTGSSTFTHAVDLPLRSYLVLLSGWRGRSNFTW